MHSWKIREGDEVYIRATVLSAGSDAIQVRIEDFPRYSFTTWAPPSEIALLEDLAHLRPPRRSGAR